MRVALGLCVAFYTLTMVAWAQEYTVTHEPADPVVMVGETFQINVIYHPNPQDTTAFARMALDYDSTLVRLVNIENGLDVPAYSQAPFINWGPVTNNGDWVAQHVYLGQWFCTGCDEDPWGGHAITYTFEAVGVGVTQLVYPEYGLRMNYVDMQPWVCYPGYVAEYTSDVNGLRDCINLLHLPTSTITVDPSTDVLLVEYKSWGSVKELFRE